MYGGLCRQKSLPKGLAPWALAFSLITVCQILAVVRNPLWRMMVSSSALSTLI